MRRARRLSGWLLAGAVLLLPMAAPGQTPPEPFMRVSVDEACASAAQKEVLVSEIRVRLPDLLIVEGDVGPPGKWRVRWTSTDGNCELTFEGEQNSSTMRLQRMAGESDIQLAASRIAWLTTVSRKEGSPFGDDDEENEETPEEEEAASEEDAEEDPPQDSEAEAPPDEEKREPNPQDPAPEPPRVTKREPPIFRPALRVSLVPGVTFPRPRNPEYRQVPRFSVNLLGGHNHAVDGLELGNLFNIEDDYMHGVQLVQGVNLVGGEMRGVQTAGVANINSGRTRGISLAGLLNASGDDLRGAQLSSLANIAGGDSRGLQVSVGVNIAEDLHGLQMGILNVGEEVGGLQLGLVNIAESSDMSIGAVNVMYGEPLYVTGWGGVGGIGVFGLQHGSNHFRWSYLLAVAPAADDAILGGGAGIGTHIPFDLLYVDIDLIGLSVSRANDPLVSAGGLIQLKGAVGWEIFSRFAIFGGPHLNVLIHGQNDDLGIVPEYGFFFDGGVSEPTMSAWPGLHFGIRI